MINIFSSLPIQSPNWVFHGSHYGENLACGGERLRDVSSQEMFLQERRCCLESGLPVTWGIHSNLTVTCTCIFMQLHFLSWRLREKLPFLELRLLTYLAVLFIMTNLNYKYKPCIKNQPKCFAQVLKGAIFTTATVFNKIFWSSHIAPLEDEDMAFLYCKLTI